MSLRTSILDKLAHHPKCAEILEKYNSELQSNGKVNTKKFWEEIIHPEIPDYALQTWYGFVRRFKTETGLQPITLKPEIIVANDAAVTEVQKTLLSMNEATKKVMSLAMNISATALQEMIDNPESVPLSKRAEIFAKVMKAQDSRVSTQVKALGQMRNDEREQQRFEKMMEAGAF